MADPITVTQAIRGGIQLFRVGSAIFGRSRPKVDRAELERTVAKQQRLKEIVARGGLEELRKFGQQIAGQALTTAVIREAAKRAGELIRKVPKQLPKQAPKEPPKQVPRVEPRKLPDPGRGVIRRDQPPVRQPPRRTGREVELPRQPEPKITRTPRRIGRPVPTPGQVGPPAPAPTGTLPAGKSLFPAVPIALGTAALVGGVVTRDFFGRSTRSRRITAGAAPRSTRDAPSPLEITRRRRGGPRLPGPDTPPFVPPGPSQGVDPLTIQAQASQLFAGTSFGQTQDPFLRRILAQLAGSGRFSFAQAQTSIRQQTRTRQKTKECQEVLRRRRRRGKCREGFFEELPGKTRFTTWRVKECATGKTISEV